MGSTGECSMYCSWDAAECAGTMDHGDGLVEGGNRDADIRVLNIKC